jgi:hypothetical protein
MHLDFASEYARRSDEELRLLIKDRHNLVDEARDALDVEVQRRKSNGFQLHVQEPEEPRLHIEEDEEEGNEIIVHSRELIFPKICPRCLAPANAVVRISCNDPGSWGLLAAADYLFHIIGYLFRSYSVPYCRACAISVRVRRWVQRLFFAGVIAWTAYLTVRYELSTWRFMLVFGCLYLVGVAVWMLLELSKRWPPAGVEILSRWTAQERRLQFANPAYEKAFIALNGARPRRVERA